MWCHLPTGFKRKFALRFAVLLLLFIAFSTTQIFSYTAEAAEGVNKSLNFQARLLRSNGGVVPDGYYNIQFKLYQDGTGTAAGNPGGTLKWTETYINDNSENGVQVKNGLMSVNLGSKNPFGTSVDWNQDTLWLSMNVAGADDACTTFGSGACTADGEMLPMKQLTSTPYSLNSGAVGGKTADQLLQLAQGVQSDAQNNASSIFINKTGTDGNFLQFQNGGADAFTLTKTGNIFFGSGNNHQIAVGGSGADTAGKNLTFTSGTGGSGAGSAGGDLLLQGGDAGGTNGTGGNIAIDAGSGTGSGSDGTVSIGSASAGTITIGSTDLASTQTINIGNNNTASNTVDVTVGNGGSSTAGTTTLQAKNSVTIKTNGTTRATFSDTTDTVYFGNGVSASTPSDYTIQGTNSTTSGVAGGSLSVQGGSATTGNANGGDVVLSGGAGSGTGADGLVVLTTPTFSTVTNDANCYTSGSLVATSCTLAAATINGSSAVITGFSTTDQTATVPAPTNTTPGKVLYVMAAKGTREFVLIISDEENGQIPMRENSTATLIWNGDDWTPAGSSSTTSLQDAYNSTSQSAGGDELTVSNSKNANGLTVKNSSDDPVNGAILEVKSATNTNLFSVRTNVTKGDFATDGQVNNAGTFATNWEAVGTAVVSRDTTDGYESESSAKVEAGVDAVSGIRNKLTANFGANNSYTLSVYAKLTAGSNFDDFKMLYTPNNGADFVDCANYNTQTISSSGWSVITCEFTTTTTPATGSYMYFVQPTSPASARTFLIDNFSIKRTKSVSNFVEIGNDSNTGETTLLTLDKHNDRPDDNDVALLGSMYYDTSIGNVQCYEAEGWGDCGSAPDTFITISPEYSNAVMNGADIGTISSDLCSDELNINDGSSAQPTVCGTDETYNFYNWTSSEITSQTRSIYVTYQLPETFDEFVTGSTSLLGRTDGADAAVSYQVYRDSIDSGLIACGETPYSVSTGVQTSWQEAVATGGTDPATCGFEPGESLLIRIDLDAASDDNAYVSNLNFTFSSN